MLICFQEPFIIRDADSSGTTDGNRFQFFAPHHLPASGSPSAIVAIAEDGAGMNQIFSGRTDISELHIRVGQLFPQQRIGLVDLSPPKMAGIPDLCLSIAKP
jgi:hypothetical protein